MNDAGVLVLAAAVIMVMLNLKPARRLNHRTRARMIVASLVLGAVGILMMGARIVTG
ncbi:hypothetical protein [Methylobacterium nigriterrae]|uniref:hypothetical protein n=1 Tax=Methylobacterium nigriterrae TaxID=3127512 RepID=UPI00301321A0